MRNAAPHLFQIVFASNPQSMQILRASRAVTTFLSGLELTASVLVEPNQSHYSRNVFSILLILLKICFIFLMSFLLVLFLFSLLLTWSWAQNLSQTRHVGLVEVLTTAAVEWGAIVSLLAAHFYRPEIFLEVPKMEPNNEIRPTHIPILLVPSLHLGPSLFSFLYWRLKSHFFQSIWPLQFKSFLKDKIFLERQLGDFIDEVFNRTNSPRFYVLSFGTSYPIVSRVLEKYQKAGLDIFWIAVSAPSQQGLALRFVSSSVMNSAYNEPSSMVPDLLIHGEKDTVCYPSEIFKAKQIIEVPEVGHFGCLLHSKTTQTILSQLASFKLRQQELRLASEERRT